MSAIVGAFASQPFFAGSFRVRASNRTGGWDLSDDKRREGWRTLSHDRARFRSKHFIPPARKMLAGS
jgi:hypothetical protein